MQIFFYFSLLICIIFTACKNPSLETADQKYTHLRLERPSQIKDTEGLKDLSHVIKEQIEFFDRLVQNKTGTSAFSLSYAQDQLNTLRLFYEGLENSHSEDDFYHFLGDNFNFYKSTGSEGKVLFTGYYCPVLNGSLTQSETISYPLYSLPQDLVTLKLSDFGIDMSKTLKGRVQGTEVVPYYTRKEIDEGMGFQGMPLIYVRDPVEAFILHIQGSGFVQLEDASLFPVHYAGTNGHKYVSLGGVLINDNKIPKSRMSMQAIKAYLHSHPEEVKSYLYKNPSYVFFKQGDEKGALGSMGLPVRGARTIAADSNVFPKGSIAYIVTEKPVSHDEKGKIVKEKFSAFVIDRDTGGAIKGPGRVDIYWGIGRDAEFTAGYMKSYGQVYYLRKKEAK